MDVYTRICRCAVEATRAAYALTIVDRDTRLIDTAPPPPPPPDGRGLYAIPSKSYLPEDWYYHAAEMATAATGTTATTTTRIVIQLTTVIIHAFWSPKPPLAPDKNGYVSKNSPCL